MDCWKTLGIAATADKREIKRAYAKLVKENNPEEKPKEYQELRQAYDRALELADYLEETEEDLETESSALPLPVAHVIENTELIDSDATAAPHDTSLREKERSREAQNEILDAALAKLVTLLRRDPLVAIDFCRTTLKTEAFQALDVRYELEGRLFETLLENGLLPFPFLKYLAEEFQWDIDPNRHGRMVIGHFDNDARFSHAFYAVAHHYLTLLIREEVRVYLQGSYPKLPAERFERLDAILFADARETELPQFCKDRKNRKLVETACFFLRNNRYVPPYISLLSRDTEAWLIRNRLGQPKGSTKSSAAKPNGGSPWSRWSTWLVAFFLLRAVVAAFGVGHHDSDRAESTAENTSSDIYSFPRARMDHIENLRRRAQENNKEAQYELALEYLNLLPNPVLTTSIKDAMDFLRRSASQGYAPAQERLGILYYTEPSVQDYRLAIENLTPAADHDQPDAIFWLSRAFDQGNGVEQDKLKASQLLDRSVALGSTDAMRVKGLMLIYGYGEKKDIRKGTEYLQRAVDKGNLYATYQLAYEYLSGRQLPVDYGRSRELMESLASKQVPIANFWLSQFYEKGWGIPKNPVEAKRLLGLARERPTPVVVNEFAWQLATNHNKALRNGALAVQLMEALLVEPRNADAQRVDTLAAAYAESGNFANAVQTEQRAISLLPGSAAANVRGAFEMHLKRYQMHRAYVQD